MGSEVGSNVGLGFSPDSFLTCVSRPETAWTTVNVAEATPGVQTPLAWSLWSTASERGIRTGFFQLGVLSRAEIEPPATVSGRIMGIFHGYVAANVDTFRAIADRTPGSSGNATEQQLFGSVRPGMADHRTFRRYPVAMFKTLWTVAVLGRRLAALRQEVAPWWVAVTAPVVLDNLSSAPARFREAAAMFEKAFTMQICARMLGQGLYDAVARLARSAGKPGLELELVTGYGSFEEVAIVSDLRAVARGRLSLHKFLRRHGFHGPSEGSFTSSPWREDPRPVQRLVESYRRHDKTAGTDTTLAVQRAKRERAECELLRALPIASRLKAHLVLRLARRIIPLGEVGKSGFLMALDALRAAARSHGRHLTAQGVLEEPDDIFMLTVSEAFDAMPDHVEALVANRRRIVEDCSRLRLPRNWVGQPIPAAAEPVGADRCTEAGVVSGIPASPGIVTGTARVITDRDDLDDLENGEILVCEVTDPGWACYMYLASALVIDIGGAVSHGAVLARELGIPCVINTGTGTRSIRTGDTVLVDGIAGTATIQDRLPLRT
jgi:phosphohistidine swiveling domain-containing protein